MDLRLSHPRQIFGQAVDLLVSTGTLRERLHRASKVILGISPSDFSGFPDLQAAYEAIDREFSKIDDVRRGRYEATVAKMSSPTMNKVSELILTLDRAIRAKG